MKDPFARLVGAANSGAFALGSNATPTPSQIRAGNYAKGSLRLQGLPITIETPMHQPRRGKEDGKPWEVTCMAHYGYINGVVGADGDNLDVFVGPIPESQLVVVINQVNKDGAFDEHKVVLGFHDQESALLGYTNSYMRGWRGLGSYVACSLKQFKAWIKSGDLSRPLAASDLITDEGYPMDNVLVRWNGQSEPEGQTLGDVMYALRKADTDKLLLDSATMADVEEFLSDGSMLDALVIEYSQFERKANQLLKVMTSAAKGVKPVSVEVSKPFKNKGTTQVAMLFAMDDGQSVSVFFHNPDSTPNKLAAADELISWKWVLNKKDITLTVAPEKGQDLNPREVGRRIMGLVEKNSAKFLKSSAANAEKSAEQEALKGEVESKTAELQTLDATIADLQAKLAQKAAQQAPEDGATSMAAKFDGYVQLAADSVQALRVSDVHRVISSAPAAEQAELGAYLTAGNPKLAAEVQDVLADLQAEQPTTPAEPAPEEGTDDSYMAKMLVRAEQHKADIIALGGTPMTEAEFMALVNSGANSGYSVTNLQDRLAEHKADLEAVKAGRKQPRAIVGKGGTKKGAIAWLERSIAQVEKALAHDGFMYTVNVNNYEYNLNAQLRELKASASQADMLGDDPALRDNRTNLEKLTAALQAGNAMGALSILDAIEDPDVLRELVLKAGFSLGASGTKDEILASVGKDLVRAAKAKVDGFGLRELDKAAAPAMQPYAEWETAVIEAVSELFDMSYGDASGVLALKGADLRQLYADKKSPEDAARSVMAGAFVEPETDEERAMLAAHLAERAEGASPGNAAEQEKINRLLGMFTSARKRLEGMQPGDAYYGNLVRDIADMAKQLWDAGYRGPEASQEPASAAPAAEPGADDDTGTIAPEGRDNTVKTAKGTKVATGFKVIDAKNLVISHESDGSENPDYPSELQPRDRARATSQAWVSKTARNLDPDSLGRTNRADSGAPIVGPDRVVESGNGRAMAIREAYRIGQAGEYREWLIENADYFGVDVAKIERLKAPVLVRVRTSDVNRAEFAVEANQDDKLAMTATEKARSDAKRLDSAMLAKLADGDLTSAANRDFINAFLQSLGDAEAAQYLTSDGRPTSSLINRIQAALFAGAYSDDRLLELTADVSKPEIANIVSALNSAAPDFMRAKELDVVGGEQAGERVTDSVELSLNQTAVDSIINATNMLRKAKESGLGLEEFLRQGDMFGDVDPAVAAMAMFISQNNRSAKRLGTAFKAMAQFVETEVKRKQTAGLFGDEPASFTDIVKAANAKLEQEYGEGVFAIGQDDLFSQPAPSAQPQPAPTVEDDQEDALNKAKAYLDSIIEGTADFSNPDAMMKELERIYGEFGEGALSDLFAQAAEAFSVYALKMTAEVF